jgi:hypothetical protein
LHAGEAVALTQQHEAVCREWWCGVVPPTLLKCVMGLSKSHFSLALFLNKLFPSLTLIVIWSN